MAKHYSGNEEIELMSKFEKLLQVCDIAREQYYQDKSRGTKENNIAATFQYSSSVPKDIGTSSFLKPKGLACFGEQVPRRSRSKATRGEPSLLSSSFVDDYDHYLKDKEVPSRFCMFNGKRYGEDHDYLNDEMVCFGEQVPRRSRSKATRGEPSLLSSSFVDNHDYLKDKEVPSRFCMFNGKRYGEDHDYLNDEMVCFGEQVPRRSRSKATRGEPSLLSSSFVDNHDYLKDKEVPSRFCMFNGKRYGEDHDYLNDEMVCFGEQVPRRSRSKATRGEPSLLSSSFVDNHDYLKDKEVPSRFCMFNGKRYGEDHDYLNDDKALLDRKGKKKLRTYYDDDEDYEYSQKEKKPAGYNIVVKNKVIGEIAPLPLEFGNRIEEMGGDDVKLIIQKQMFDADADRSQNRFSIPIKQIREDAKGFLTKSEIEFLPFAVPLIEPNHRDLTLIVIRKWNYTGTSSSYMLSGPWTGIRERHNLRAGMVMQVWSFRVDGQLHLALVKVSRDNERDHGINGIANTSQIHAESHDQQHMMRKQVKSGNEADRQGARASCSQAQGCSSFKS